MPNRKPMTPSETLVGRRLPAMPSHRQTLLASFVKPDRSFCGKLNPSDSWLKPAFAKLRKEGLISRGLGISFGGRRGKNDGIWYLKEKAYDLALTAYDEVEAIKAQRKLWSRDFHIAYAALRAQKRGHEDDIQHQP